MTHKFTTPRMVLGAITLIVALALPGAAADKPNIVLLYADDAGYADFGFHRSHHFKTPNLDRLAKSGTRMSQFYMSASVCGPSRAGMLTGKYQQRFGFEENNVPGIMSPSSRQTGEEMGLPLDQVTMGDHLKRLGYRTAVFGKWHLGEADRYHPTKRGFDEFFGFRGGARSFFPYPKKAKIKRGNLMERGFGTFQEHEGYLTNALADEACAFIERTNDQPFFAYVSFNAVHAPMHVDPQDQDTFPQLTGIRRKAAQMTLSLDRACGQIVDKLAELGLTDNTLVVFTNDNGGPSDRNGSSNHPFGGTKATHLEGGIRVPGIVVWPGKIPSGKVYDHPAIALDLLPTFVNAAGGDASAIEGLDGVDLLPHLRGAKKERPHQTLYWKINTRGTIRDGDWKLMRFPDRPAELYNFTDDPLETTNVAGKHPDKVKELFEKFFEWELQLQRPLFMLRPKEERWSADRYSQFRKPPKASY